MSRARVLFTKLGSRHLTEYCKAVKIILAKKFSNMGKSYNAKYINRAYERHVLKPVIAIFIKL